MDPTGDNNAAAAASHSGAGGEPLQRQTHDDGQAGGAREAGEPGPQLASKAGACEEQVALITGSASGIGRGTARAFAALNYRLALVDKQADRLAETGRLCAASSPTGHKPLELALDLAADNGGQQVAQEIIGQVMRQYGRLDVLVNNAGITSLTKFDDPTCLDNYHRIIATNMHSVVYLCLAAYGPLKQNQGSIINVSSMLDTKPARFKFAYCMSKAAITMLTKCLANDLAPYVRVNCVSPGPIASSILDDMGISLDLRETNAHKTTLVQRIGKPEEVAKMITFLASKQQAAFITGSRVLVDGGYTIKPSEID